MFGCYVLFLLLEALAINAYWLSLSWSVIFCHIVAKTIVPSCFLYKMAIA